MVVIVLRNLRKEEIQMTKPLDLVQIERDPFGRLDYIRRSEPAGNATCAWCGNVRKGGKLFRYGIWYDGGRKDWGERLFCSRSCCRNYHR